MEKRIIKFRAYLTELEKMIPASQVFGIVKEPINAAGKKDLILKYSHLPENISIDEENSDNYILMQFTGLLDKNDKEIYEGDILRLEPLPFIDGDTEKLGTVEWDNNRAAFNISGQIQVHPNKNWEIIGNIYEHEHLLK